MKRPFVGTRKKPSKILLASTSLPVALLIAKGLMSSGTAPGWSQNSDLDVPTGQTRPAAGPTTSPLLPTGFPASPVDSVPLDSQPGTPLPSLTSDVLVPIGNNPSSVFETPTGQESTSPLLPVDAPPGPEVGTADSDNGLGPFSRLYDGEGFSESFGHSVFTPAYLPSYDRGTPTRARYNLTVGPLNARLYGAVEFEYNDNINLGDRGNRHSDFSITPTAGVGISWIPSSGRQSVELNVGVGYRWYLNHSELNSVIITPSTSAQYNFGVGPVKFNVHDQMSIAIDPIAQGQISSASVGRTSLLNYRRINNTLGIRGDWRASSLIAVGAGYDYKIDRSLTDQFKALDHDEHTFSAGVYSDPTPRLRVGLAGTYTIINYTQNLKNSGTVWTLGPNARFQVTTNLVLLGAVGYTASTFDAPTANSSLDTSNFRSVSYEAGIRHHFLRDWKHELMVTRGASLGIESNFADYTTVRYEVEGRIVGPLSLLGQLRWEDFKVSGQGGEHANRYLLYAGLRYHRVSQPWSAGLGYSYVLKESNVPGQDYYQNRVTLDLSYQF